jgi:putative phosphoribosyl transferase
MRGRAQYRDRSHAGTILAGAVADVVGNASVAVLALPRGGVPVSLPVASRLSAPLGLMLVRKLGVPGRPELAMGALARYGQTTQTVRHDDVIADVGVDAQSFERVRQREEIALTERSARYGDPPVEVTGRVVVLVDDGLATGMTALAAVAAARTGRPSRVVVAVPVGSPMAVQALRRVADQVVCPLTPRTFVAVSTWYDDFDQLSDTDVLRALKGFSDR